MVVTVGFNDIRITGVGSDMQMATEKLAVKADQLEEMVYESACKDYEAGMAELDECVHRLSHIAPTIRGAVALLHQAAVAV